VVRVELVEALLEDLDGSGAERRGADAQRDTRDVLALADGRGLVDVQDCLNDDLEPLLKSFDGEVGRCIQCCPDVRHDGRFFLSM